MAGASAPSLCAEPTAATGDKGAWQALDLAAKAGVVTGAASGIGACLWRGCVEGGAAFDDTGFLVPIACPLRDQAKPLPC